MQRFSPEREVGVWCCSMQLPLAVDDRSSFPPGRVRGRKSRLSGVVFIMIFLKNKVFVALVF